jgi:hypothetical protein
LALGLAIFIIIFVFVFVVGGDGCGGDCVVVVFVVSRFIPAVMSFLF